MPGYDEFVDPNSAIARIIAQMQGAADRSNPGPGPGMPGDLPVSSAPQPGEAQPPRIHTTTSDTCKTVQALMIRECRAKWGQKPKRTYRKATAKSNGPLTCMSHTNGI